MRKTLQKLLPFQWIALFSGFLISTLMFTQSIFASTLPLSVSLSGMLTNVMPAVVNITVLGSLPPLPASFSLPNDADQDQSLTPKFQSVGSGFVADAQKGYIVTNAHLIKDAKLIAITFSNGIRLKAKKIGADEASDIAVLQIQSHHTLTALPFADSEKLNVGDYVAAIGNPFGLHQTVTAGVVSALHRSSLGIEGPNSYEDFIQTDAPINPGNSGGALVNMQGQLVGMNTAILAPDRGSIGIGFSIPSNMIHIIMLQLIEHGKIDRGIMGVMVQNLTPALAGGFNIPNTKGTVVTHILAGSPADKAGLKVEDIIQKANGIAVTSSGQLRNITGMLPVGATVNLDVERAGHAISILVKISDAKQLLKHTPSSVSPLLQGIKLGAIDLLEPMLGHVKGLGVLAVDENSEAWLDGLRRGDVIVEANKMPVTSIEAITKIASSSQQLLLKTQRANGVLFVVIN